MISEDSELFLFALGIKKAHLNRLYFILGGGHPGGGDQREQLIGAEARVTRLDVSGFVKWDFGLKRQGCHHRLLLS